MNDTPGVPTEVESGRVPDQQPFETSDPVVEPEPGPTGPPEPVEPGPTESPSEDDAS